MIHKTPSYVEYVSYSELEKWAVRNVRKDGSATVAEWNGALICESKAIDERAYVYRNFYLPRGATVEITFEGRQTSVGAQGRMALDLYLDNTGQGGGAQDWIEMDSMDWKPYSFGYTSRNSVYASATFGLWQATIGKCEFRNIVIKIYNGYPIPTHRMAMITGSGTSWNLADANQGFANVGCKSVSIYGSRLRVDYAFMHGWYRPIVLANISANAGFEGWNIQPYGQTNEFCQFTITDKAGNVVAPESISAQMWFAFRADTY